ncbi:conserved domain protein [Verrucomicrobiia bacterium DG1235]|nr:conserved domain protein [Verrucomicrobiae bacterium DG1235]
MKSTPFTLPLTIAALALSITASAQDEELTPYEQSRLSEQWDPKPEVIDTHSGIPGDAIILFDGSNLDAWELDNPEAKPWKIEDGAFTVIPQKPSSGIHTKQSFGDVQLHLEFRSPTDIEGHDGQDRGNSGIFFMGQYEIQVLDSYQNDTYVNGQLGSIYKQYPPLANPARKPGEWQSYDIIFIAPKFHEDGTLKSPARMTAILNGVLVQYDSELFGPTEWIGFPKYKAHAAKLPISLQDHQHFVSYRNIWIRELDGQEIQNRTIHPDLKH